MRGVFGFDVSVEEAKFMLKSQVLKREAFFLQNPVKERWHQDYSNEETNARYLDILWVISYHSFWGLISNDEASYQYFKCALDSNEYPISEKDLRLQFQMDLGDRLVEIRKWPQNNYEGNL